jgi:hypothetical protein
VFNYANGVSVEQIKTKEDIEKHIIPADSVVNFEKLILTNQQATKILNGVFENLGFNDGIYRVYNQTEFWGIGIVQNGVLKIKSYVR